MVVICRWVLRPAQSSQGQARGERRAGDAVSIAIVAKDIRCTEWFAWIAASKPGRKGDDAKVAKVRDGRRM